MVTVREYYPVHRVHVVPPDLSKVAEGIVFDSDELSVLRRQTILKILRVECVKAHDAVAPRPVENDGILSIPRRPRLPRRPLSVYSYVLLIGFPGGYVTTDEPAPEQHRNQQIPKGPHSMNL